MSSLAQSYVLYIKEEQSRLKSSDQMNDGPGESTVGLLIAMIAILLLFTLVLFMLFPH